MEKDDVIHSQNYQNICNIAIEIVSTLFYLMFFTFFFSIIHLQRFVKNSFYVEKNPTIVSFDLFENNEIKI